MIYISNFNHAKTIADNNCYTLLHVNYVWAVVGLIGGHPSWTNMYLAMLSEFPKNTVLIVEILKKCKNIICEIRKQNKRLKILPKYLHWNPQITDGSLLIVNNSLLRFKAGYVLYSTLTANYRKLRK